MPELEFVETPVGMIYIGTRRVGQNVWARMVEAVLPNLAAGGPDLGDRPRGTCVQRSDAESLGRAAG